jgi:hypothetical protein
MLAGCCDASCLTVILSSSHCATLSSSCAGWLLRCLLSRHLFILLLCHPLVLLLPSHCAALLLSHLTGWLLRCLLSYRPLVVLSLHRSLVVLHRLVVASTLLAPPSRSLVMPPLCPLVVLSLCCPPIVSSCRLVVASPLVVPLSCCPITGWSVSTKLGCACISAFAQCQTPWFVQ